MSKEKVLIEMSLNKNEEIKMFEIFFIDRNEMMDIFQSNDANIDLIEVLEMNQYETTPNNKVNINFNSLSEKQKNEIKYEIISEFYNH